MVEPSSLADTVTPSSFWPDCAVIAPFSSWSAAWAGVAASRDVAHARSKDCALLIGVSLFLRFVRRHGNGSHVGDDRVRSEEHTSELQSLAYLVCRLLL